MAVAIIPLATRQYHRAPSSHTHAHKHKVKTKSSFQFILDFWSPLQLRIAHTTTVHGYALRRFPRAAGRPALGLDCVRLSRFRTVSTMAACGRKRHSRVKSVHRRQTILSSPTWHMPRRTHPLLLSVLHLAEARCRLVVARLGNGRLHHRVLCNERKRKRKKTAGQFPPSLTDRFPKPTLLLFPFLPLLPSPPPPPTSTPAKAATCMP